MTIAGILRELQRRNVVRAAVLYATSVWALAQGIAALGPIVGAPDWTARWFLVAAAIGVPFWIAFAWFYELTPQGIKLESEVPQSESLTRATGRKLDFWIIGVLAVAVVLLLTDRFMNHNTLPALVAQDIPDKSVAVLPLVNESGDSNAAYFSDGLSEAFIDALSQFPGLRVIARASSFQFRNSKDPVRVIGEKLGVAHLLEGSVQRASDAVRINVELINSKDGTTQWFEHYDRPYKDLFQLQDDITHALAAALKTKLLGGSNAPPPQSDRPPSGNLAAYNAYLEGRFYTRRTGLENNRNAVEAFTASVKLDPAYATAWAALSSAEHRAALIADSGLVQALAQARKDAEHAMELAPDLGVAHSALGNVLLFESNWSGAEAQFRRAVQLSPGNANFKANLGSVLAALGQTGQAVTLAQQAQKLDPLQASIYNWLASYLMPLDRLDEADSAIRKAIALEPDGDTFYATLSQIDILRGTAKAALSDAQQEPAGSWHDLAVALALQIGSNRSAAEAALNGIIAKYSQTSPYQIAETYGLRKDTDNTFKWLERARAASDPGLQQLLYDPFILPYRHDPRFAKLCEELKLPVPKT
jgi:TolB-like protein/Flp pilus assembly protein TadD